MEHASARHRPLWLALALVGLLGFALVSIVVAMHTFEPLDRALLRAAVSLGAGATSLWNGLSTFGNYPMIPIAIAFVLWLFWHKQRREAIVVIAILVAASLATEGVKALVARERPLGSAPAILGLIYSYPSGHALEDVMILGMITLRVWRSGQAGWLKVLLVILAVVESLLVGFARLALQVHFPLDILGGYFGGLAALGFYAWATGPGAWAAQPSWAGQRYGGAHRP